MTFIGLAMTKAPIRSEADNVEMPHAASPTKHEYDDDLVVAIRNTFLNSSARRVKVFTRYVFA